MWMQTDGPKAIATFGRVMWDTAQGDRAHVRLPAQRGNSWWRTFTNGLTRSARPRTRPAGGGAGLAVRSPVDARAGFNAGPALIRATGQQRPRELTPWPMRCVLSRRRSGQPGATWCGNCPQRRAVPSSGLSTRSRVPWGGSPAVRAGANSALGGIPGKVLALHRPRLRRDRRRGCRWRRAAA